MVTSAHKASHRIFPNHSEALTPVFEALRLLPPTQSVIEVLIPEAAENGPPERQVDTVLKVKPSDGDDLLLAIAFQSEQDADKPPHWACHVAYLHMTYELPVLLLVVCRSPSTAIWAAGPFESRIGTWRSQVLQPLVLGPDDLPEITNDSMVVQQPALAALSAIVHGDSEKSSSALEALARGIRSLDRNTATYLCQFVEVGLEDAPARKTWRELLGTAVPASREAR